MSLVIATTTRYLSINNLRCQLALEMISHTVDQKIPVVMVDSSSNPEEFRRVFERKGVIVLRERSHSTMGSSRRQAFAHAAEQKKEVVVWLEPEKAPLVPFLRAAAQPILSGAADIVVPSRSREGLLSYPRLQMYAEQCGNEAFRRLSGLELDAWFGPRLMNQAGLDQFLAYDGLYGDRWDSIFIPLLRAQAADLRLQSMPTEYRHPPIQTETEEIETATGITKRLEQLQTLVTALSQEAKRLGLTQ